MRTLVGIAIALVVLWVIARIVIGVTGFLLNLLLIAGVIALIVAVVRSLAGRGGTTSTQP